MQVDQYLQGFSQLATPKPSTQNQSIEALAKQFEGQFFSMLLKSARATAQTMGGDFLNGREMQLRQENYDNMLVQQMSGGALYDHFLSALANQFDDTPRQSSSIEPARLQPLLPVNRPLPVTPPLPDTPLLTDTPPDIVEQIYDTAKQYADQLGISPKLLWAQSMLETGWGKHLPSSDSNNIFGRKAKVGEPSVDVMTHEVFNGVVTKVTAGFKRYQSIADAFKDYVDLIANSPRYAKAMQATSDKDYIQAISEAGYATDPDYADKVMAILSSPKAKELR